MLSADRLHELSVTGKIAALYGAERILGLIGLGFATGAHLSQKIKTNWIICSLALALGLVGIRLLMVVFQGGGRK